MFLSLLEFQLIFFCGLPHSPSKQLVVQFSPHFLSIQRLGARLAKWLTLPLPRLYDCLGSGSLHHELIAHRAPPRLCTPFVGHLRSNVCSTDSATSIYEEKHLSSVFGSFSKIWLILNSKPIFLAII